MVGGVASFDGLYVQKPCYGEDQQHAENRCKHDAIRGSSAKAKKYFTGKLLFLSTKSPPMSVEKKVTPTKNNGRISSNI